MSTLQATFIKLGAHSVIEAADEVISAVCCSQLSLKYLASNILFYVVWVFHMQLDNLLQAV